MRFNDTIRVVVLLNAATVLAACETVPLTPGAAAVRITYDPSDVASCTAVGNVDGGCSAQGAKQMFEHTIRNRTIEIGGNTVLVTNQWQGMVCEGTAYDCRHQSQR
jgi:hypothetical protein